MDEGKIITVSEAEKAEMPSYEELLILKGRVDAFMDYANIDEYSIPGKVCAAMLGYPYKGKD